MQKPESYKILYTKTPNFTLLFGSDMKHILLTLGSLLVIATSFAQDKLFTPEVKPKTRYGFIITGDASADKSEGDLAKLFGASYRIGGGLLYKTKNNWLFGANFDFIVGSDIRCDSLMLNIRDKYNASWNGKYVEIIGTDGGRAGIPFYERGIATGVEIGKIITTNPHRPDNGILLLSTIGFIQYKIDIYDQDNTIPELRGSYKYGYDRLTNGPFYEQYAGYVYFSKSRLINFHVGIDALFGFTKDRRGYLYDVMRYDNNQRHDIIIGLKGGWFFPMFKRKSEDILFE